VRLTQTEPQENSRPDPLMLTPFLLAKTFDSVIYFQVSDAGQCIEFGLLGTKNTAIFIQMVFCVKERNI
jgi:hypothetical protein